MSRVTFRRIASDQANIHDENGECIGEIYRERDILNPARHHYIAWLTEDPRGSVRIHDRCRIREIVEARARTHPYW